MFINDLVLHLKTNVAKMLIYSNTYLFETLKQDAQVLNNQFAQYIRVTDH